MRESGVATDVLILGGGIAGLATAWHLGRLGSGRVVLLEREPALGRVSSAQNAAILRTFGADLATNAIARAAADFLRRPPSGFAPFPLVETCGLLLAASGATARKLARVRSAGPAGTGGEELTPAEARRLAPHAALEGKELLLHFPGDGRLDVAAMIDAFAHGARASGAQLRTGAAARRLLVEDGRVSGAEFEDGSVLRAGVTVLAAGAWAGRLGKSAGSRVELRPTRRHLLVTAPDPRIDPAWPVVWFEDEGFYCRPESGGLLLSACDISDVDPDACFPEAEVRERIAAKTARLVPDLADAGAAHFWCGLRTLTADDRFAVGHDPDLPGLFWVAGLGGHGMSCGPEVGRIAAALLADEDPGEGLANALGPARLIPTALASR